VGKLLDAVQKRDAKAALRWVAEGSWLSEGARFNGVDAQEKTVDSAWGWARDNVNPCREVFIAMLEYASGRVNIASSLDKPSRIDGKTPIETAIEREDSEMGLALIQAGASLDAARDRASPLCLALERSSPVSKLLALAMIKRCERDAENAADKVGAAKALAPLNALGRNGLPALLMAIDGDHVEAGLAMIKAGSDLRCSAGGSGALERALARQTPEAGALALAIIRRGVELSKAGDPSMWWVDGVSGWGAAGPTPLMLAIKAGNVQAAVELVGAGASLVKKHAGVCAFAMALESEAEGMDDAALAMIERAGASLAAGRTADSCLGESGKDGLPLVVGAIKAGKLWLAKAMMDAGADMYAEGQGETALTVLAATGGRKAQSLALDLLAAKKWRSAGTSLKDAQAFERDKAEARKILNESSRREGSLLPQALAWSGAPLENQRAKVGWSSNDSVDLGVAQGKASLARMADLERVDMGRPGDGELAQMRRLAMKARDELKTLSEWGKSSEGARTPTPSRKYSAWPRGSSC
jgi:ankyrin repeat protein